MAPMISRLIPMVLLSSAMLAAGCLDVRDFEGTWSGQRVGESDQLKQGFDDDATALLSIDDIDLRSLNARLTMDNLFENAVVTPIPGAEADVLTSMSFDGSPQRVFMAFVQTTDGDGDAMVMVALYDDPRVVVRVMRGGTSPLYGIFSLRPGASNQRSATSRGIR